MTIVENKNNWDKQLDYLNGKPLKTLSINNIKDFGSFKDRIQNYTLLTCNWLLDANRNSSQAKDIERRYYLNL